MVNFGRRFFFRSSALSLAFFTSRVTYAGDAENILKIINNQYGAVCKVELLGLFSKTLKIDWTSKTVKFQAIKILAEIGSVKDKLFQDGVRYFQFPNSSGTYNVIDWKTGEKKYIAEKSPYYF